MNFSSILLLREILAPIHLGLAIGLVLTLNSCAMSFSNHHPQRYTAEVTQMVGSMNRAQQAYLLEHQRFSESIPKLGIGIPTQTNHYQYSTQVSQKAAFNYGITQKDRLVTRYFGPFAYQVRVPLYSAVGGVFWVSGQGLGEVNTLTILCRTIQPGVGDRLLPPKLVQGKPVCAAGTEQVGSF